LKIFIDTNIFLDVIFNRDNVVNSTLILNSCYQKLFDGYVADITLLNIDYVASKQTKDLKNFLKIINQTFTIIGADNKMFDIALKTDNNDLEDTIQYVCAHTQQCDIIVSNDKNFYRDKIEVLNSESFVKEYLQ